MLTHSPHTPLCRLLSAWPTTLKHPDGLSDVARAGVSAPSSQQAGLPSPCSLSEISSWVRHPCGPSVSVSVEARGEQASGDTVGGGSPRSLGIRTFLHVHCARKGQGKQQVAAVWKGTPLCRWPLWVRDGKLEAGMLGKGTAKWHSRASTGHCLSVPGFGARGSARSPGSGLPDPLAPGLTAARPYQPPFCVPSLLRKSAAIKEHSTGPARPMDPSPDNPTAPVGLLS